METKKCSICKTSTPIHKLILNKRYFKKSTLTCSDCLLELEARNEKFVDKYDLTTQLTSKMLTFIRNQDWENKNLTKGNIRSILRYIKNSERSK